MKKIGFIGVYDKIDLILCIAKILTCANKKVLIADATINQKCKYIIPVINPTKSYITEYEGIDIAVGFESLEEIKQYFSLQQDEKMDYDVMIIDTDNFDGVVNFNIQDSEKIYYISSFDAFSLKKGIELLQTLHIPMHMTKVFFSKQMLKEEEDYFEYLSLGLKVVWNEDKLYFLLENGDQSVAIENQRVQKIKLKNLSNEYKQNLVYLVDDIDCKIGEKQIKNIVKSL